MGINLDGIELNDEIKAKILEQNADTRTAAEVDEEVSGLKAKRDELLAAHKADQDKKLLAEENAESERLSKLQGEKKFKELSESYQLKIEKLEKKEADALQYADNLRVRNAAFELAKKISDGDQADLLAEFLVKRLQMHDGELKVTDPSGALTISSTDDLLDEFKLNPKFAALVSVTRASGGKVPDTKTIQHDKNKLPGTNIKTSHGGVDMNDAKDKIAERLERQGIKAV